jgi:hypothetical protein
MLSLPTGREASARAYVRHRPERTLLYQLVEAYYPAFLSQLAAEGTALPGYVEREFEDYLKCGRLEHGFLRVRCDSCHATHLIKKAEQTHKMAYTGAVTLIQRFGSGLNLNIHFHMLFLDGVYSEMSITTVCPSLPVCMASKRTGVAARTNERDKLERLCRYISRPAVSEKRLSLTANGNIRYQLKTPYKDGTTHVIFEPMDFIARLARATSPRSLARTKSKRPPSVGHP